MTKIKFYNRKTGEYAMTVTICQTKAVVDAVMPNRAPSLREACIAAANMGCVRRSELNVRRIK